MSIGHPADILLELLMKIFHGEYAPEIKAPHPTLSDLQAVVLSCSTVKDPTVKTFMFLIAQSKIQENIFFCLSTESACTNFSRG